MSTRDPLAPVVEGVDFSGFVNRYSFECQPFFTDASDSATMLDGSTVHDVFPLKARFSWTLNSLSAEQYAALNAAFNSGSARDTVTAQIFDPTIDAVRLARFHVTRPVFVYNFTTRHYMSTAGSALILEDAAPRALPAVTPTPRSAATRDPLAPVIDGFDLSGMVNRYSFRCEPFETEGDNGGTLLDGSTVLDVLANKFRLSWTLNAISAQQYAGLCAVLSSGTSPDTVSASVYNPILNAAYTAPFHVTFPVFRFAFDNGQCMAYADSSLVLEEAGQQRGLPVAGDDDWRLYDDGILEIDSPPEDSSETEDDRWKRILEALDTPTGNPNAPIQDVERVVLKPNIPSLPSGVIDRFPNVETIVIPPNVEISPDAFDNCPSLTIIKIVSYPAKSDYWVGETLNYAGLSVIESSGDTEQDITPECVLLPAEGYLTTEAGDIMVDVRYQDESLGTFWVAVAEVEVVDGGDWWTLYEDGTLDIYCVGNMPNFSYNENSPWYEYVSQINRVTIGNSVTSIGERALRGCTSLTSVTIPDSVTSIGVCAFVRCTSLTSVTIPDGVTSIGEGAFEDCSSLTSVTIPDSVTSIGGAAFNRCTSLTSVTIPDGVTYIGSFMFDGCSSLTSVTIPDGVRTIRERAFRGCSSLTSVTIPDGVNIIRIETFYGCSSLTSVMIPSSVKTIESYAFGGCTSLTNVTIPDGVTSIGVGAFKDCTSLTSVTIPDGVTAIESSAFNSCTSLTSVMIPNGVTSIGRSAFSGCTSLTSIIIPGSVTTISNYAFAYCRGLTSVTIPDSVTTIEKYALYKCTNLTSVTIGNGVTIIWNSMFSNCSSLTSVTIGNSVKTIESYAFSGCTNLTSVMIPNSAKTIESYAFYATALTSVTINRNATVGRYAFPSGCVINYY